MSIRIGVHRASHLVICKERELDMVDWTSAIIGFMLGWMSVLALVAVVQSVKQVNGSVGPMGPPGVSGADGASCGCRD